MKRKNLKTKISLGILMACLITGNIGFAKVSIVQQDGTERIIKTDEGSYIAGEIFDGSTGKYQGSKLNVDYKGNTGGIVYGTVKNYDELTIVSKSNWILGMPKGIYIEGQDVNIENVKNINITSSNDGIFICDGGDKYQSVTINNFDKLNITTEGLLAGYALVANGIRGRITVNGGIDSDGNIKGDIVLTTKYQAGMSSGQVGDDSEKTGGGGDISITSKTMNITSKQTGIENRHRSSHFDILISDRLYIDAAQGITASAARQADKYIGEDDIEGTIDINAGTLEIKSKKEAILASNGKINVTAPYIDVHDGTIGLSATKETFAEYRNIDDKIQKIEYEGTGGEIVLSNVDKEGNILHNTKNNGLNIAVTEKGINAVSGKVDIDFINSGVSIVANNTNPDKSVYGLYANNGNIDINTNKAISIGANIENITLTNEDGEKVTQSYGRKHSIKAEGGSDVDIIATGGDNKLYGVVYAKGDVKTDYIDTTKVTINHGSGNGSNYIYSSAHGSKIEDEENNVTEDRSNVVAALYAQNKGKIEVIAGNGGINHIETYYANLNETNDDSERTIWAQRGGVIEIKGTTIIKSSNAEHFYTTGGYANNSRGVAITAGSGDTDVAIPSGDIRSTVNLEYGPNVTIGENTFRSEIYGDIVAGYGGKINIKKFSDNAEYGLYVEGNALAANGGTLDMNLGEGGTWYGRADDYQDANGGKLSFYNPVFSNKIESSGTVNIIMGEGSKWYLTGQSWVSSLNVTQGKGNVTIDMARFNKGTHSLTISELIGKADDGVDATFVMDLDHINHDTSDMLYIKNATGEYDVVLNDVIDGMDQISEGNVLRFATVQGGASFNSVTLKDAGLYNLGFEIDHSEYDRSESAEAQKENESYNNSSENTTVGINKPGNDNVEDFFFGQDKDSEDNTQKIMLNGEADAAADNSNSVQNWYITKVSGQDLSDPGKTVVNMSKVNYSNAVYMDRLNKRLGEARYINTEEDQGMWVRMRHDRIGKDNEFRIMNTMYELGYDEKQECDNGERRVGAAIDYMDGSSEYTGVGGSGDVSRKGIWLYDTWLGDKGHYSDFVAKWGHLSNDFTLYRGGDKITGDFSNNVYSISAEYGRKKDIGNNWYFEPQVQLQYARVTDANYTTSQGTEVSLDAINSLIARAGFRLGKDLGERSTVYFKADLLHEFLGDQDIYATDGTGTMDVTYGNEGTWCDIGFGFATAMSKTSYAYLDVETSLGNDYEETYQINAGLQWSF